MAMPMTCLRPPAPSEFERSHSPKINHERVKSTPQIWPYGTRIRPARECRCRTVRVITPTIPSTTINTITAGHPRAARRKTGRRLRQHKLWSKVIPSSTLASRSGLVRLYSGSWSAATATYFAFRDDVLTRLIARQAEMQYAYEDRIAELRARVDRTTSHQLLDQEQFDQKLDQIMRRQTTLESRATALGAIPDASVTGSIRPPARGAAATDAGASGAPKPSPISDTVIFVAPPDREARLESRAPVVANAQP